ASRRSCVLQEHRLAAGGGVIRSQRNLHGPVAVHSGDKRRPLLANGGDELGDHRLVGVGAPIQPVGPPHVVPVDGQVLAEGVHEDGAALRDQLEGQPTPRRPVGRAAPARVDGGEDAILEAQHLQRAGLYVNLIAVDDAVRLGVYFLYLAVQVPAHDVYKMDGMVDNRAAAGQLLVDKPVAVGCGQLALIDATEGVDLAQLAAL